MAKAQTSPTEHWDCHDLNWQNLPPIKNEHAWKELNEWSHKYDVEMCKGWSEEIENLLIFTGLFGATVTAFAVEAFQWLQEDPNERNSIFLAQISLQIANLTNPGLLAGSSIPIIDPIVTSAEPFDVEGYILRVNVLWMLSLTLSLSTVLIGILCMQWLREFLKDSSLSPKDNLPIRYLRFQGLNAWKVPQIVSSLPLLLQISVILFFAGLIDLLWHLHTTVAIFVIVLVTLVLTFVLFTTISPASQVLLLNCTPEDARFSQCPYKSPQSWLVVRLLQILRNTFRKLDEWLSIPLFTSLFLLPMLPLTLNYLPSPPKRLTLKRIAQHLSNLCRKVWHLKLGGTSRSWVELEISWHRNSYNQAISDAANGIVWLSQTYQQNQVVDCLVNCLPTLSYWVLSQLIIALGYPTIVDEFEAHLASLPADELWGPNWNSYSSGCTVLSIHIIDRLAGTSLKYRTLIHELTIRCINSMPRETINFLRPAQYQDIFNRCFRVDPSDNDKDQFHEKIRLPSFLSFADRLCQDRDELWQPLAPNTFFSDSDSVVGEFRVLDEEMPRGTLHFVTLDAISDALEQFSQDQYPQLRRVLKNTWERELVSRAERLLQSAQSECAYPPMERVSRLDGRFRKYFPGRREELEGWMVLVDRYEGYNRLEARVGDDKGEGMTSTENGLGESQV